MGKIYNFNKIKFEPFKKRIGDISVRNFWLDKDGVPKTLQSHLNYNKFSYFEIVKYEKNPYYGKYEEYLKDGWEEINNGQAVNKDWRTIHKSCFQNEETCYTLAVYNEIDHDELTPDLTFVGSRPFQLTEEEQKTFWQIAKIGQEYIEEFLNNNLND